MYDTIGGFELKLAHAMHIKPRVGAECFRIL
jgi:hypothetical protein